MAIANMKMCLASGLINNLYSFDIKRKPIQERIILHHRVKAEAVKAGILGIHS